MAIDAERNLYVLVGSEKRPKEQGSERSLPLMKREVVDAARKPSGTPRKLIKLKSWEEPELMAVFGAGGVEGSQVKAGVGEYTPQGLVGKGLRVWEGKRLDSC